MGKKRPRFPGSLRGPVAAPRTGPRPHSRRLDSARGGPRPALAQACRGRAFRRVRPESGLESWKGATVSRHRDQHDTIPATPHIGGRDMEYSAGSVLLVSPARPQELEMTRPCPCSQASGKPIGLNASHSCACSSRVQFTQLLQLHPSPSVNCRLTFAMGTCHRPLEGLNPVLLRC